MADVRRKAAWLRGFDAAIQGFSASICSEKRGTIYFDDWNDGFEEGSRRGASPAPKSEGR